jgi:lysophospholipase L1-like esterase
VGALEKAISRASAFCNHARMFSPTLLRTAAASLGLFMITPVDARNSPASPPARMVIIGASYAAGWGSPPLPGYTVVNKGVGGEDSSQVRARFARDVIADQPQAVLVWGHINDIHRAPADRMEEVKQRIKDNYRAMHAEAKAAGIRLLLATEVTLSVGDGFLDGIRDGIGRLRGRKNYKVMVNDHVKDVNAWLREYAREHALPLLDLERAVDSGKGSRRAEYDQPDGGHINEAGYAALTRYATEQLR